MEKVFWKGGTAGSMTRRPSHQANWTLNSLPYVEQKGRGQWAWSGGID